MIEEIIEFALIWVSTLFVYMTERLMDWHAKYITIKMVKQYITVITILILLILADVNYPRLVEYFVANH